MLTLSTLLFKHCRGSAESNAIFRSQSELVQAMNDPRYDNDPAYRSDVMTKLENSDLGF